MIWNTCTNIDKSGCHHDHVLDGYPGNQRRHKQFGTRGWVWVNRLARSGVIPLKTGRHQRFAGSVRSNLSCLIITSAIFWIGPVASPPLLNGTAPSFGNPGHLGFMPAGRKVQLGRTVEQSLDDPETVRLLTSFLTVETWLTFVQSKLWRTVLQRVHRLRQLQQADSLLCRKAWLANGHS